MQLSKLFLKGFQSVCRFNFGNFETEEFKKFLKMGVIFAIIIGVYWTLRPLKDAVFIQLVSNLQLPFAKTASVIALLPLVMFYTKLLENHAKEKMFVILPVFYGVVTLGFSFACLFLQAPSEVIASRSLVFFLITKITGYLWYIFVESFGSLVVALFWAFAADTTQTEQAKRGFPLVVAIGQIGGIIFPYSIGGLPDRLHHQTDFLSIVILGCLILLLIPLVKSFIRSTPKHLMQAFVGKNEKEVESTQEMGFFEGLKLLLKYRYLLGIFAVNFIYEVIVTIFDFNFKLSASDVYSGVALSRYLSVYGSSVNIVSLSCLLLGISNITRFLGVKTALMLMPIIVSGALFGFLALDSLTFLFALMVGSKAINYALNGPALKQLYIPTTQDVKFKAQAWIETFGSRLSKQTGSMFNMSLSPLKSAFGALAGKSYYLMLSGFICFPLLVFWLIIAMYLGNTFKKAIDEKNVVC
jgi:AAA family ATP:ADP antiporter